MFLLTGCLSDEEPASGAEDNEDTSAINNAPVISGNPQGAINMGDFYTFTPDASDPDGDALNFSISNRPPWASFDEQTGTLQGQPSLADVGVYSNIQITVSDGTDQASLAAFEIEVSQVALGSMTLSWTPPTENTDGSALTDLAGYRFYYGTTAGNYPKVAEFENPGLSTVVIENLVPDTYYVVATAINTAGVESPYSNEAVKVVE